MTGLQLIPSMDCLGGRVVRLRQGDRGACTFYELFPEDWVERLASAGARRIHLVDLDGAFGAPRQPALLGFVRRYPKVRFQLGGGLRTRDAVAQVIGEGGDAVVGTLAIEEPGTLRDLPRERLIVALDLKEGAVATRGWRRVADRSAVDLCADLLALGFDRALVTDVSRDGTGEGPGLATARLIAEAGFRVQASGGIRGLTDLLSLAKVPGVVGAISGRALLEGTLSLEDPEILRSLRQGEAA